MTSKAVVSQNLKIEILYRHLMGEPTRGIETAVKRSNQYVWRVIKRADARLVDAAWTRVKAMKQKMEQL